MNKKNASAASRVSRAVKLFTVIAALLFGILSLPVAAQKLPWMFEKNNPLEKILLPPAAHSAINSFADGSISNLTRQSNLLTANLNALPPCELNYFGDPIQFSEHGGFGNFPVYDRYGTGPCPNPDVVPPASSPLMIYYIGNPPTSFSWEVYFRLPANLTGATRTINSTVWTNGTPTGSVQIVQSGNCSYYLGMRYVSTYFSAAGGQEELEFRKSPNCPSTLLSTDVSWMSVTGTTLTVNPLVSTSGEQRDGKVIILTNDSSTPPIYLPITQFGSPKPVVTPAKEKPKFIFRIRSQATGIRG